MRSIPCWCIFALLLPTVSAQPPCRKEEPTLQHFYDETKSATGLQVLTFSLDNEPSRVWAYRNDKRYTFPVIADRALGERLLPREGSTPKIWVINPQGLRSDPFADWTFGRILLEVQSLAGIPRPLAPLH